MGLEELNSITHWAWGEMATNRQMTFSNAFPWMELFVFLSHISLNFVPMGTSLPAWEATFMHRWLRYLLHVLTHWGPDKMAATLADDIFTCNFFFETVLILIKISLNFVPRCPTENIPELVQIMAWHRIGDKPLSESMLTLFTGTYMQH